jgi:hypothetical protein
MITASENRYGPTEVVSSQGLSIRRLARLAQDGKRGLGFASTCWHAPPLWQGVKYDRALKQLAHFGISVLGMAKRQLAAYQPDLPRASDR